MASVTIVDYGLGNIRSVVNAFEAIDVSVETTKEPAKLLEAERIVLPGVGAFEVGMKNLEKLAFVPALEEVVLKQKKPFLGICLGMQLLADKSFEHGEHKGLGWVKGAVEKLPAEKGIKIPHVGWNDVKPVANNLLFNELSQEPVFYFVHSYHFACQNNEDVAATCNYGIDFTAALQRENIFATQFHPEKSQRVGLQLLRNFVNWGQGND